MARPSPNLASNLAPEIATRLREWNDTDHPIGPGTVVSRIKEQAASTPDQPALVFRGESWSYARFDHEVDVLAQWIQTALKALGLAARDLILPVVLHRGFSMFVAIHAIARAGAAYLPLDPSFPKEVLVSLLTRVSAPLLFTTGTLADSLQSVVPTIVAVDEELPQGPNARETLGDRSGTTAGGASRHREIRARGENATRRDETAPIPADLAYVIFTSGTTGTPKGVMVEHRALLNRLVWMGDRFPLSTAHRVLHKTPYTFDVSVWELFWPLMHGATIVIAEPHAHMHMRSLAELIEEQRITDVHFVPSILQLFVECHGTEDLSSLQRLYCSGEALPSDLTGRFLEAVPGCGVFNLYGPTEAAIDVSCFPCSADDRKHGETTPLGWPVYNTQLVILDEDGRPVDVGVAGELFILGAQLARGYHNDVARTDLAFVPNGFADTFGESSTRMYRTGDRARWREDGAIEFLGRVDRQVKVHGIRIELGEVEARIQNALGVSRCVALTRTAPSGVQLVAALEAGAIAEPEARKRLREAMPQHLVPGLLRWVDSFPVTANGKLDRKALAEQLFGAVGT